jgi:hypothetical protein
MDENKDYAITRESSVADKINGFMKNHLTDIVLVIACAVYIIRGVAKITETGKSIPDIIADGVIAFLFGYVIARFLMLRGLFDGKKSEQFIATMAAYGAVINMITPYIEKLDGWCETKNKDLEKKEKEKILLSAGISYNRYKSAEFDINKCTEQQKIIVKRAENLKLRKLTSSALTSEKKEKANDPFYLGKTAEEYMTQSSVKDFFSKAGLAVVLGYFGVELISDFSWETLLWYALQVAAFLVLGIVKYTSSYLFTTGSLRNRFIAKTNILYEFLNEVKRENEKPPERTEIMEKTEIKEIESDV